MRRRIKSNAIAVTDLHERATYSTLLVRLLGGAHGPRGAQKGIAMIRSRIRAMGFGVLFLLYPPSTASAQPVSFTVRANAENPQLLVFSPKSMRPSPVVVMLHGRCDVPENECPRFAEAVTEQAWLVCPRGDVPCAGGGATWSYPKRKELPSTVLSFMKTHFAERIDARRGHTLMGFSMGAIAAVDAIGHANGDFSHLVLIGAKVEPTASALRRSGFSDVVTMAGQWDMTWAHMQGLTRRLALDGMRSRFVDLGPIGHWLPLDMNLYVRQALSFYAERNV
jgi:predicted esterase